MEYIIALAITCNSCNLPPFLASQVFPIVTPCQVGKVKTSNGSWCRELALTECQLAYLKYSATKYKCEIK